MAEVTVYHNPRCTKSRQTVKLLEERGIQPRIVAYLDNPPTARELKKILKMLDAKPRDVMRKKEKAYKELDLDRAELTDEELIAAMVEHPILIERPIVVHRDKAALGRPPEAVLEVL